MKKKLRVLMVSIGYSPNVGGIETHFDDLTSSLSSEVDYKVLTYMPLTSSVKAKLYEKNDSSGLEIFRIPIVRGLFYKLVDKPVLEFLYLTPLLFFFMPFLLLIKYRNIDLIHSHGLVAGLVSVFWGKVFDIKVITTTHSVYSFKKGSMFAFMSKLAFGMSDLILCLSKQSVEEMAGLGISRSKISKFTYWVDSRIFKPSLKKNLVKGSKFTVLFVGRLVKEKGVVELLNSLKNWPKEAGLVLAGSGPLSEMVEDRSKSDKRILFAGKVQQVKLPELYSSADLLIVPSVHEEGFGRVVIESLMCGTPVMASARGGLVEAIDESVGELFVVSSKTIAEKVSYFVKNRSELKKKSDLARNYALSRYGEKNSLVILNSYKSLL